MSSSMLPRVQAEIVRYGMTIVLILGVIGNSLVIILFSRRRSNSCAIYLIGSAILNILALILIIILQVYNLYHQDPTSHSLLLCKLRVYFAHAWVQSAKYLMICACIDRYLLTINNIRFRALHRSVVARRIAITIVIFYHIFIIHLPIMSTIVNGRCVQVGIYNVFYQTHVLLFLCLIPPILMAIFGYLAYRNMKNLHKRIRPIDVNTIVGNDRYIPIDSRDRDLLTIVLVEISLYIITMSYYPFVLLEISITTYLGINKSIGHLEIESFLATFSMFLIYVNSAAPFYVYVVVSKIFRRDCNELFTKFKCRFIWQNNQINITQA